MIFWRSGLDRDAGRPYGDLHSKVGGMATTPERGSLLGDMGCAFVDRHVLEHVAKARAREAGQDIGDLAVPVRLSVWLMVWAQVPGTTYGGISGIIRARRRSGPALPYMERFSVFKRLT